MWVRVPIFLGERIVFLGLGSDVRCVGNIKRGQTGTFRGLKVGAISSLLCRLPHSCRSHSRVGSVYSLVRKRAIYMGTHLATSPEDFGDHGHLVIADAAMDSNAKVVGVA